MAVSGFAHKDPMIGSLASLADLLVTLDGQRAEVILSAGVDESRGVARIVPLEDALSGASDLFFEPALAAAIRAGVPEARGVMRLGREQYRIALRRDSDASAVHYRGLALREQAADPACHAATIQNPAVAQLLGKLASKLGARREADYLAALVEVLADLLEADFVYACTFTDPTRNRARVLASWCDGAPGPAIEYDLAGTPCNPLASSRPCFFPDAVQELFPADQMLKDLDVRAYTGIPLSDMAGRPIGFLVALFRQPRRDGDLVLATMRIFAAPASVELERAATALSLSAERARSERLKTCLLDILRTGKLLQSPSRDILDQLVRPVPDALDVCRAGV